MYKQANPGYEDDSKFSATQQYASGINRTALSKGNSAGKFSSSRSPRKTVACTFSSSGDFFSANTMLRLRVRPSANVCSTSTSTRSPKRSCTKTGSAIRRRCLDASSNSRMLSPN
eukprot:TRINITY_DN19793_c0_g2_i2.p1 TRINITY_DN19793_c0_g2~~TRINITY_DN19793_c0_g2_i2.p1  ORF type:complete len:115 (+),score=4.64 TRINITY_DN19793_c0_g2_i2:846-1190(+)